MWDRRSDEKCRTVGPIGTFPDTAHEADGPTFFPGVLRGRRSYIYKRRAVAAVIAAMTVRRYERVYDVITWLKLL